MNRFERAQRMMEKAGVKYVDIIHDYLFFIKEALGRSPNGFLLDACCGPDSSSLEDLPASVRKIGFDINPEDLKQNERLAYAAAGDLISLPFQSDTFQVVCLHWGIEHIQNPVQALKEVYRILKPGGRVVMMTTNTRHPLYFLAKITPHSFHEFARRRILKTEEKEVFRTYYRANTPSQMKRVLHEAGFLDVEIRSKSNPSLYAFSAITFYPGLLFEKILDLKWLSNFRMFMVASGDKGRSKNSC